MGECGILIRCRVTVMIELQGTQLGLLETTGCRRGTLRWRWTGWTTDHPLQQTTRRGIGGALPPHPSWKDPSGWHGGLIHGWNSAAETLSFITLDS